MKTKIKVVMIILFIIAYVNIGAAAPVTEWNKKFTYGPHSGDISVSMMGKSVHQTRDGGFIFAGVYDFSEIPFPLSVRSKENSTENNEDIDEANSFLIKTDAYGNKRWNKTFGGPGYDIISSVNQTADGGYILAGWTTSYSSGDMDAWLIKTDSSGNRQWSRTFGGANSDAASSVQQTRDGGYILAGETWTGILGPSDMWLIKTDSSGNRRWDKKFGGSSFDNAKSVQQTSDNGYILAGTTQLSTGDIDGLLVKTDSSGNRQWSKTFGGSDIDVINSVRQTKYGGYILAGSTESSGAGYKDAWLIKTDASGNRQWSKTFGGTDYDEANSVWQASDNGYVFVGITGSNSLIVKTDGNGITTWSKTFGIGGLSSVEQTKDKGYISVGYKSTGCGGISTDTTCAALIKLSGDIPMTVTSPNGGEVWGRGTTKTIKWTYTGDPGTRVKIELLKGVIVNRVISSNAPIGSSGTGSYSWAIPVGQTPGANYKIRITSTTNLLFKDTSNNNFAITT